MHTILLSVGTELTDGSIVDTNAAWLARTLSASGYEIIEQVAVSDDQHRLERTLSRVASEARLVVMTGGLGPTVDDRTRPAVAAAFGLSWRVETEVRDAKQAERRLRYGPDAPPLVEAQFWTPEPAGQVLRNSVGIASGFLVPVLPRADEEPTWLAVLPGVPAEMKAMTEAELLPALQTVLAPTTSVVSRVWRFAGIPESELNDRLGNLLDEAPGDPHTLAGRRVTRITGDESGGGLTVGVRLWTPDTSAAVDTLDAWEQEARRRIGVRLLGTADRSLAAHVVSRLAEKRWTVGLAESCTAGLATHLLGAVPGVSAQLLESVVTYSNEAKVARTGVSETTLQEHGAVSASVAAEMAVGWRAAARVDLAVSITGIAGPDGGSEEKPVGLVWFGVASPDGRVVTGSQIFPGDRAQIQLRAAQHALFLIYLTILGEPIPSRHPTGGERESRSQP